MPVGNRHCFFQSCQFEKVTVMHVFSSIWVFLLTHQREIAVSQDKVGCFSQ